MFGKSKVVVLASALLLLAVILSCSEDSNYDQRTVVYVGGINGDKPFLCDVLSQGDSLYEEDNATFKTSDDFITEDWVEVVFYNKPYSTVIEPGTGSLGDFLVTGYDVSFIPLTGTVTPVHAFSGSTAILVPGGESVAGNILLVPFAAKNIDPLNSMKYSPLEIMARAHFTFHGHYVQTNTLVEFAADLSVNFADPLLTTKDQNQNP
ncbi:MAG: hypothetical protein NTW97_06115 [Candidatus Krumholzibacteria bacterium]|nr:hypothetical protein [Candidatus Krumholzibacteria bacterium]